MMLDKRERNNIMIGLTLVLTQALITSSKVKERKPKNLQEIN